MLTLVPPTNPPTEIPKEEVARILTESLANIEAALPNHDIVLLTKDAKKDEKYVYASNVSLGDLPGFLIDYFTEAGADFWPHMFNAKKG